MRQRRLQRLAAKASLLATMALVGGAAGGVARWTVDSVLGIAIPVDASANDTAAARRAARRIADLVMGFAGLCGAVAGGPAAWAALARRAGLSADDIAQVSGYRQTDPWWPTAPEDES